MVKFSKQMELQLVPEWRHKFCDYWQLKKEIKRMKLQREKAHIVIEQANEMVQHLHEVSIRGMKCVEEGGVGVTTWTPLSGLTKRTSIMRHELEMLKVHQRKKGAEAGGDNGSFDPQDYFYQTEVLEPWAQDPTECAFFLRLDEELNKVNEFFCSKELEFIERAEMLSRQLTSLTQIRNAYEVATVEANTNVKLAITSNTHYMTSSLSNNSLRTTTTSSYPSFASTFIRQILTLGSSCASATHPSPSSPSNSCQAHQAGGGATASALQHVSSSCESDDNSSRPLVRQSHVVSVDEDDVNDTGINDEKEDNNINNNDNDNDSSVNLQSGVAMQSTSATSNQHVISTSATNHKNLVAKWTASICAWTNLLKSKAANQKVDIDNHDWSSRSGRTLQLQDIMIHDDLSVKSLNGLMFNIGSSDQLQPPDENCVSMRKIKHARKMLRAAFVEFYRGLGLLRTFSSLNALAFAKILKKHDKVTGRNASETYMKVVEKAHFSTSDKVIKMMDEVERLFTEHFAKDDEKKAMMLLRPVQNEAPHTITFFLGLFTGCSLALLLAYLILLHLFKIHSSKVDDENYWQTTYEVFGMLFLILLHMYLYGWNIYAWRKTRINYAFIFEFAPKTELRHREVLLVCTGLTTMILGGMVGHLMAYSFGESHFNPDMVPLITMVALLLLLICPFNVCYRSSRVYFLQCMKRVVFSPFYKVLLADFFLADQLTSQVTALRSLQFVMCYFFGGFFQNHNIVACGSNEFRFLVYLISFLPYWWRLMQCLRRWLEEGDQAHLANGGKYLSAMVAAGARISYSYYTTSWWLVLFVITSSFATLYQMYWDTVRDWGFFQPNSQNPWLRDQLLLKNKSIYYFSIILNFILRFAWLQQVTHWQIKNIEHNGTDIFFAALEVIRRGHWNFYRLENEHLNNVGKYRAIKLVPLPFRDSYAHRHV